MIDRSDLQDVVAIVMHLTRIVSRKSGSEDEQAERMEIASVMADALCASFGVDPRRIASDAMRGAAATGRAQ